MEKAVMVLKADGTLEPFKMEKLQGSLRRAGASPEEITDITHTIEARLTPGITTEIIYREAFELLRQSAKTTAARYSLRRAMVGLGPTGFPFEDYVARLFAHQGYETTVRNDVPGKCVIHEVDVLAYRGEECIAIEAKFHQQPGTKSDLQVVLYSHARFQDISGSRPRDFKGPPITKLLIVTNTKFTTTAIQYARCVDLELLAWGYPQEGNLEDLIEASKLYPITVLQTLTAREKQELLRIGIVLCGDIIDKEHILRSAGVPNKKIPSVIEESRRLCRTS
jgi:hypothetical protein